MASNTENSVEAQENNVFIPKPVIEIPPKQDIPHLEKAWAFFRSMGSPKYHVAPMVDQSELPFRMLCRKYGSTCAYSPMLHARLYCIDAKYRSEVWSTCEGDRPLLAQFCANDPDYLVKAASMLAPQVDGVDINFGCPQRIAKRGYYGAFLMDDLTLVEKLVTCLAQTCPVPVTCKIRVFPDPAKTLAYARMIERSGCCLLAVHGRTREQRDTAATRADWDQIRAVKQALSIPVLANGNVRNLADADACMAYTGCDGVMSAESLLVDPALFDPRRLQPGGEHKVVDGIAHCLEYLRLCVQYPTHLRMVKGHVHKLCGPWLAEHTDLRAAINKGDLDIHGNIRVMEELAARVAASGRDYPIPAISQKALDRQAREESRKTAIEEQERETAALLAAGALDAFDTITTAGAWPVAEAGTGGITQGQTQGMEAVQPAAPSSQQQQEAQGGVQGEGELTPAGNCGTTATQQPHADQGFACGKEAGISMSGQQAGGEKADCAATQVSVTCGDCY